MSVGKVLIAGCGFLGLELAHRLRARGYEVIGLTHAAESAARLASEVPFTVQACDLADAQAVSALQSLGPFTAVVHCASSGRGGVEAYRTVYLGGMQHLATAFSEAYLVFTSSTSVYAQVHGEWVTEESPAEPTRETGQVLLAAEGVALAQGGAAARLAGIYGPGRSVLLKKYLAGEAVIEGDGTRWLNQIHRDDAAEALATLVAQRASGVFNVADDTPLPQRELYAYMAQMLQGTLPFSGPIDTNRKRGWTHKQVANAKLRALGWAPRFPSFFTALEEGTLLAAARGE